MKELQLFTNWRNWILLAIGTFAFMLAICEPSEDANWLGTLITSKLLAVGLITAYCKLFAYWEHKQKLPEISNMFKNL